MQQDKSLAVTDPYLYCAHAAFILLLFLWNCTLYSCFDATRLRLRIRSIVATLTMFTLTNVPAKNAALISRNRMALLATTYRTQSKNHTPRPGSTGFVPPFWLESNPRPTYVPRFWRFLPVNRDFFLAPVATVLALRGSETESSKVGHTMHRIGLQ